MMQVGQTVYFIEHVFHRGDGLVEGVITKLGRKYVYVKSKGSYSREFRFDRITLLEDTKTGVKGRLYLDKREYMDKTELSSNIRKIQQHFGSYGCKVSLEKTRRILAILNEEEGSE